MQTNATLLSERNTIGIRAASAASFWTDETSPVTIRSCGTGLSLKDGSNAQLNGALTVENTTGTGSGIQMDRNSSLAINKSLLITNDTVWNTIGINMGSGAQVTFSQSSPQTVVIQNNKTGKTLCIILCGFPWRPIRSGVQHENDRCRRSIVCDIVLFSHFSASK
jgi:hypothetical protein